MCSFFFLSIFNHLYSKPSFFSPPFPSFSVSSLLVSYFCLQFLSFILYSSNNHSFVHKFFTSFLSFFLVTFFFSFHLKITSTPFPSLLPYQLPPPFQSSPAVRQRVGVEHILQRFCNNGRTW